MRMLPSVPIFTHAPKADSGTRLLPCALNVLTPQEPKTTANESPAPAVFRKVRLEWVDPPGLICSVVFMI